ncbi:MAG: exonuclease subunit SbcD [Polyangiaceae bacterium]
MRIVHTSDWHAGRVWKGLARTDELEAALSGLAAYLSREEVDLLLVTGDIFDHAAPSPEAERVVFQFLKRVGQLGVESVVIAGNHDHAGRMDAWGALTALAGSAPCQGPRPKPAVLEVITRRGGSARSSRRSRSRGVGDLLRAAEVAGGETEARQRYADQLRRAIHRLAEEFRADAVNLLMAHTHFEGAVLARSERAVHCTEQWTALPEALAPNAHYVALGHIHRPQEISGGPPARYAGSPMQLDFGEMGDVKSFVVIDAEPRLPARITLVPYEGPRPLHELRLDADSLRVAEESGIARSVSTWRSPSARGCRVVVALAARIRTSPRGCARRFRARSRFASICPRPRRSPPPPPAPR